MKHIDSMTCKCANKTLPPYHNLRFSSDLYITEQFKVVFINKKGYVLESSNHL